MSQSIEYLDFTPEDKELKKELARRNALEWDDAIGVGGLATCTVGFIGGVAAFAQIEKHMSHQYPAVPPTGPAAEQYAQHEQYVGDLAIGALGGVMALTFAAGLTWARVLQRKASRIEKQRMDNFHPPSEA